MTVGLVWRGRSSAHVHVTYISAPVFKEPGNLAGTRKCTQK